MNVCWFAVFPRLTVVTYKSVGKMGTWFLAMRMLNMGIYDSWCTLCPKRCTRIRIQVRVFPLLCPHDPLRTLLDRLHNNCHSWRTANIVQRTRLVIPVLGTKYASIIRWQYYASYGYSSQACKGGRYCKAHTSHITHKKAWYEMWERELIICNWHQTLSHRNDPSYLKLFSIRNDTIVTFCGTENKFTLHSWLLKDALAGGGIGVFRTRRTFIQLLKSQGNAEHLL